MKDGLRSVSVTVVSAVLGTSEPLFQAEIPSGEKRSKKTKCKKKSSRSTVK